MKRMSRTVSTLALLIMSLGTVPTANAVGLAGFSPDPATLNGAPLGFNIPAWFQDQNGVAVQPCLDPIPCGLVARAPVVAPVPPELADPGFDLARPLVFPSNFPDEFFYFAASVEIPVGPVNIATIDNAIEVVFVDPAGNPVPPGTPNSVAAPFQRLRFAYFFVGLGGRGAIPPEAQGGSFTISTPWGDSTFAINDPNMKCEPALSGDTKCIFTRDLSSVPGVEGATVLPTPDFNLALGNGTVPFPAGIAISTYLQDPAATPGFLGTLTPALSFTGAPAGRLNRFSVTDPMGNTGSTTQIPKGITGMKFGMEVKPLVNDFAALPVTAPVTTSPAKTITVTNPDTLNPMILGTLALAGTNSADFTLAADTCSGQTLAAVTGKCTFDVTFAPKSLAPAPEAALRTAMVNIPGTLAGVAAPTAKAVLSGTAQFTMASSVGANGTISPVGAAIPVNAGATMDFAITPNAKFKVKDITVNGTPVTFTPAATPGAPVAFISPPIMSAGTTVNATFMPSGDLDGDGILSVSDALMALKFIVGLQTPTAVDLVAMKVTPLDAAGRPNGSGAPDLNDVVLILRRVLDIVTW